MTEKAPQNVTPKQDRALVKLLAGGTDAQAAKAAGVDRRQVFRWRHEDEAFAAALHDRQAELFQRAMRKLGRGLDKAARTMNNLTDARDEAVRLRAAVSVIEQFAASFFGTEGKQRLVHALGVQINVGAAPSPYDFSLLTEAERGQWLALARKCLVAQGAPPALSAGDGAGLREAELRKPAL